MTTQAALMMAPLLPWICITGEGIWPGNTGGVRLRGGRKTRRLVALPVLASNPCDGKRDISVANERKSVE